MDDALTAELERHAADHAGRPAGKFEDPYWTAKGEPRAVVVPHGLKTLWFNTGTLCNIACEGCYIESSPRNDQLSYLSRDEVRAFLAEAQREHNSVVEIGFTGGEPFMNPEIIAMLEDSLSAGYRALVLTNAMSPMRHHRAELLALNSRFPARLALRASLDHFTGQGHERVRGPRTWASALEGLKWLSDNKFDLAVAARMIGGGTEQALRDGFADLFARNRIAVDARDAHRLVLFPEMDATADVPEITTKCWSILGKNPSDVMCASSRMVIKRKGDNHPVVVSCTLLPYDDRFEMGRTLAEAHRPVRLNHPHCSKFCVLGGASCSA